MVAYKFYPELGRFVEIEKMSQPYSSQGFPLVQQQLVGGISMYDRKKTTTFKKPMPLTKRVNMDKNVVTYIWHSQSPSYAKYGSIAIPNFYTDDGTDGNTSGNNDMLDAVGDQTESAGDIMHYPCHFYDLTCAPNYVHPSTATEATEIAGGIPESVGAGAATMINRLPVRNPCVAYSVYGAYADQGANAASYDKTLAHIRITNRLKSQEPDGRLGRNKWYLKYTKKPHLVAPSYLASLEVANQVTDNYRDMVPAGLKLTDTSVNTRSVYTPAVGAKPIHLSTKVSLCLVGTNNCEVEYDISLVRFKDDAIVPNESWNDSIVQAQTTATAAPYTENDSVYTVGAGENQTQQNNTAAALTWQSLLLPFTHGVHTKGDYKQIDKYVHFLGTRRVKISPKIVTEGDTTLNHTYVDFKLRWNDQRSFVWRNQNDQGQIQALPEYGTGVNKHGPGFSTRIAAASACTTSPSPRSRIFLLVRCRSDLRAGKIAGQSTIYSQTVDGRSILSYEEGVTPTYDISIENSWIPDTATPLL